MDDFILQTIGRLYLDNLRLQMMVRDMGAKDAQIAELNKQVEHLLANVQHDNITTK